MFIKRCRNQIHVVLTINSADQSYHNCLSKFPSIVNCCTIDWFESWPEDALETLAEKFLKQTNMTSEEYRSCIAICKYMHITTEQHSNHFLDECHRSIYITPMLYLRLINTFNTLLKKQRDVLLSTKAQYQATCEQFDKTLLDIGEIQKSLQSQVIEMHKQMKEGFVLVEQQREQMAKVEMSTDVSSLEKQLVEQDLVL